VLLDEHLECPSVAGLGATDDVQGCSLLGLADRTPILARVFALQSRFHRANATDG